MPKKPKKDIGENNQDQSAGTTPTPSPVVSSGDPDLDEFVAHIMKNPNVPMLRKKK